MGILLDWSKNIVVSSRAVLKFDPATSDFDPSSPYPPTSFDSVPVITSFGPPPLWYVVLAKEIAAYDMWTRLYGISHHRSDTRYFIGGWNPIYYNVDVVAVCLAGWEENPDYNLRELQELFREAKDVFFCGGQQAVDDVPVVDKDGKITGWTYGLVRLA